MRKRVKFEKIVIFICFFLVNVKSSNAINITKEKALEETYPEAKIEKETAVILNEQKEKIKKLANIDKVPNFFTYYKAVKEEENIGYAVIVEDVKAKTSHFTFLVAVDREGNIKKVNVLSFRGFYGTGIQHNKFLKQFKDKNIDSFIKNHPDIHAVTGATITSDALTEEVKKSLIFLKVLLGLSGYYQNQTPPPKFSLKIMEILKIVIAILLIVLIMFWIFKRGGCFRH